MSSSETAHKLQLLLLKRPKQALMARRVAAMPPGTVKVQVNNAVLHVNRQQTLLNALLTDFDLIHPNNCRAGICGACHATVNGKRAQKICYMTIEEGMKVVTPDREMMHWRQGTADE